MDKEVIVVLKALSDENRIKIFRLLKEHGERCACDLLEDLNIAQSTLSHHMKILVDCRLVNARKNGKWINYTINKEVCSKIRNGIFELFDGSCC
ncbi:ArsR family transcriptional regulator [Breznakia sp. PF5-3]|uniref:ArsR/SmtB family transcription factor n=1 Tax=unclassified Breznakia TaxID=2623764 RepID=UPI002405AD8B|nr:MULTISPECIES: metalloregulator ArsR/SmtB family transcription factor [unclassified Breznakia]MDF9824546.1 ArsR family transcriptional regulator [Breznakia sp. PM6-1]MDF9835332.1 ArsR family transcriptional regulator [Breznakia sp. PF5-3]MDF9837068.1 ArsR family transcriptional regulator [Breznakia sp. PFB2-8]MDF9858993.1 ArsR family transcriptional regulator [Breznakia sp. PH5-24]